MTFCRVQGAEREVCVGLAQVASALHAECLAFVGLLDLLKASAVVERELGDILPRVEKELLDGFWFLGACFFVLKGSKERDKSLR